MDTIATRLSDRIAVTARYVRSISIERDLFDPQALDGYVLSDSPRKALHRILAALRRGSSQRAIRLTGPYGTGKSALGLVVARFTSDSASMPTDLLSVISELLEFDIEEAQGFVPLVVIGRRTSLTSALADAILQFSSDLGSKGRKPEVVRRAEGVVKNGVVSSEEAGVAIELFDAFCKYVESSASLGDRVLLLIDELGRFLEHGSLSPHEIDPAAFQMLAERCAGAGNHAIIAIAHSGAKIAFDEADPFDDWWKVAERFEEVPLHGSIEQSLTLLSRALVNDLSDGVSKDIRKTENRERRSAIKSGLFPQESEELSFFPIHPTVIYLLSVASRKLRQNERSFFGFLQSGEAYGFQEFLGSQVYGADSWYRLNNLADYLLNIPELDYGDNVRRQRWELLRAAVEENPGRSLVEADILKCVGVINLLEPIPLVTSDEKTLAYALGTNDLTKPVKRLVDSGQLRRRTDGTLAVWDSAIVDLSTIEDAIADSINLNDLESALLVASDKVRPMVAQRHYHETGTLRFFSVNFCSTENIEQTIDSSLDNSDGAIVVVGLRSGETTKSARVEIEKLEAADDPRLLIGLKLFSRQQLDASREILVWSEALNANRELQFDDLARDEARRRRQAGIDSLGDWFASASDSSPGTEIEWRSRGKEMEIASRRELQALLSEIADQVFAKSPIIKNELINRTQLSIAIAGARNRLAGHIFKVFHSDRLGIEGTPPEYSIYLSLFKSSGLHRQGENGWNFYAPKKEDPRGWKSVWAAIDKSLKNGRPKSITDILTLLSAPPFGVRTDVALLVSMAYLQANNQNTVLLEKGLLVLHPGEPEFMRMIKSSDTFQLHRPEKFGDDVGWLSDVVSSSDREGTQNTKHSSVTDTARTIYQWYNNLPSYSQKTGSISKRAIEVRTVIERAKDPVELIENLLPKPSPKKSSRKASSNNGEITEVLAEIGDSFDRLTDEISSVVTEAFAPIGTLTKIRGFVSEFSPYRDYLKSFQLNAVVERASRKELSDPEWALSIASALTGIDPKNWSDKQVTDFRWEVARAAGQLRTWHALIRRYSPDQTNASEFLSVVVLDMEGNEHAFSLPGSAELDIESKKLLTKIQGLVRDSVDKETILAQLLLQSNSKIDEE